MFARFVASWMLFLAAGATAVAQDNASGRRGETPRPITSFPKTVEDRLEELIDKMNKQDKVINKVVEGFQQFQILRSNVDEIKKITDDHEARLFKLNEQVRSALETHSQQIARQQQILEAISQQDSGGNPIPNLLGNMQSSSEFQEEISEVVNNSIRSAGEFVVTNKMDTAQTIVVNLEQHTVEPRATLRLKVPVGTISTRLPGQALQNWTVGAPNYGQSVDIVSRQNVSNRVTTLRPESGNAYYVDEPASTTVYSAPTTTTYSLPVTTYSVPTTTYWRSYFYYPYTSYYWPSWSYVY